MKENVYESALKCLNTFDGNGVFVAVLNGNGEVNIVSKTNEDFSLALIRVLVRSVLQQNVCCPGHFMGTSLLINEIVKDVVTEILPQVTMTEPSNTAH